jgi:hypothetical protein
MPVEFLTDDEAAAFGRFAGVPLRVDLERVCFVDFTDRCLFGSASDLGFHVAYMFATAKSKDQRGRGRSLAGSAGPPSLVAGGRGGHRGSGRLTSPGRSQKAARRTWRTLAGPVGKLDDEDRVLVNRRRGEHMKLGFALQLVTVRSIGTFLEDPLDVPVMVLDFVSEQLGIADPSVVKRYTERAKTKLDHQWEIRRVYGFKDFTVFEAELRAWVAARSWTSGDGPKAIFGDAVGWLREREVLLPGVSTLARLVAQVRDDTTRRLWSVLEGLLTVGQRYVLDQLLEVPPGSRVSDLERWRKGPVPRGSGPTMIKALDQVAEVMGLGMADLAAEDLVPPRRLNELARYGMSADVAQIRRHGDGRRLATLLATVRLLEAKSIDDTLELLDLLMATELLNKAQTAANKEKIRKHPKLAKASARLAVAVEALFDSDGWGGPDEVIVGTVWEAIEAVVSRADLRAALVLVNENVPPADAADPDDWRKELLGRFTTVSGFLKVLPKVIEFGANAEGAAVLAAMEMIPDVIAYRSRLTTPLIPDRMIDPDVVNGPWKRLVFGHPAHADGAVNRHAYVFCVLEQFYRHLKRRDIHTEASTKWRNPQAQLLEGEAWDAIRPDVLTTLSLPDNPDALLAEHSRTLDAAYREIGGRLAANTEVRVDDAGKIHLTGVKAVEESPSLVDLRTRTTAMVPRVDLPEAVLEVMSWEPELVEAFTAVSGGRSRLEDLPISIVACLSAHSMNVGYRPIAKKGVPALERSRLSHVFQNYFRTETLAPANAPLVARQAGLALAQAWGGGMVAAVDGMRFVVPIPAAFARPNRKFFGSKRGMTWLNAMNDQGIGRGAKIVSGTIRDSLHMVDVIFGLDGGELPEIVVSDTGSYVVTWTPVVPQASLGAGFSQFASHVGHRPWRCRCGSTSSVWRAGRSVLSCSTRTVSRSRSSRGSCGRWRPGITRPTHWSPTPTIFSTCGASSTAKA